MKSLKAAQLQSHLWNVNVIQNVTDNFDGLVQGRHNSNALAMELRLSWTNPLILDFYVVVYIHKGENILHLIWFSIMDLPQVCDI